MDCKRAQNEILEAFDTARPAGVQAAVDAHVAACVACATFVRKQRALDRHLATTLVPPRLTPRVRAAVRERVRRERRLFWSDLLPDLVHFASCGIVMVIGLVWLPISAPVVLSLGAIGTVLTHAVLTAFHESLDAADDLAS
jgi:predicted anti-sigma-YlaC factor YlaD